MKKIILTLGFLALPFTALADFNAANWHFVKKIEMKGNASALEKLGAFAVDAQVYASAKSDLSDMRVIDAAGEEVPYHVIDIGRTESTRQVPATVLNNSFVEGKEQSLILDFGENKGAHNQVSLGVDSADRNFRRKVTVSGSDSLGNWRVLSQDNIIYDYSVDISARKTTLYYPLTNFRYLLIQIENAGGSRLNIANAAGTFVVSSGTESFMSETRYGGALSVSENKEARVTEAVVDMGQNGIAVHKMTIETPSVDFYRQVRVYGRSGGGDAWKPYVTDVLFRYGDPVFSGSQLTIYSPEIRDRFIKIAVVNNDNKPITINGVEMYGNTRTIAFPLSAGSVYYLYYGNAGAHAPQYDLAYVLERMKAEEHITMMKLGDASANSFYAEPIKPIPPVTERYPYLLNVLLGILVVIMGGLITRVLIRNQKK